MKTLRKKSLIYTVTLLLLLSMMLSIFILPEAAGHTPAWNKKTYMYVAVSPSPVGVGQQVLITWWTDLLPQTAVGQYGDRWKGVTITVTDPDGQNKTLGPYTSDPVGGGYLTFTPEKVGAYQIQSHFPGYTYTGLPAPPPGQSPRGPDYVNDTLTPANSEVVDLVVVSEQLTLFTDTSLPSEYWSRPINAENRQWYQIASNWLGGPAYANNPTMPSTLINYYGTGPETAHIIWTKPWVFGGIVDGQFSTNSWYDGLSYERFWVNPIIIQGKLYVSQMQPPRYGYYCFDLQTGEEIWFQNSTGPLLPNIGPSAGSHVPSGSYPYLSFGQIYAYDSPNQHGALAYLWSTYTDPINRTNIWQMYDAWTGNWILNINDVPSSGVAFAPSTQITAKDGSILIYNYNSQAGWLTCWNSSKVLTWKPVYTANEDWMWRPTLGKTFDGTIGYEWNVTAPKGLGSIAYVFEDRLIGQYGQSTFAYGINAYGYWSVSLDPGSRGQLLWRKDYALPPVTNGTMYLGPASVEDGIFTEWCKETRTWTGYDIETGNKVWGPTESEDQYNMYGRGTNNAVIYEGKLLTYGYDGILRCYNVATGDKVWEEPTESGGINSYFDHGRYPLSLACIVDGKIYLFSSEHSPSKPLWQGSKLRAVDIESGETLFATDHWGNVPITADGVIVDLNNYDGQITAYAKGPTETTVMASPKVSVYGNAVLVEGKVTDISAGTNQKEQAARFPQGVPAISDESMTEWMQYVYHQQAKPTNLTGVEVTLRTIDPNGNFYDIGKTTSDANGMFKLSFVPEVPGDYTIIASFAGSKAYYGSTAQTAIGVSDAPASTPQPTAAPQSMTDTYLLPGIAIIVAAIAVVGALILIALRKRP